MTIAPHLEVWKVGMWKQMHATAFASERIIDVAIAKAVGLSKQDAEPFIVLERSSAGIRSRGVAIDGKWMWPEDCALCRGCNEAPYYGRHCIRCNGAGIKP